VGDAMEAATAHMLNCETRAAYFQTLRTPERAA
jgi:hypothetical protein